MGCPGSAASSVISVARLAPGPFAVLLADISENRSRGFMTKLAGSSSSASMALSAPDVGGEAAEVAVHTA